MGCVCSVLVNVGVYVACICSVCVEICVCVHARVYVVFACSVVDICM